MALRKTLLHVCVSAGLMLAAGGCVDTSSVASPDATAPRSPEFVRTAEEQFLVPVTLDPLARYLKTPHAQDYWIKQWIGPRGGTVDFQGFRIVVPPGAVDRVTKFEIRIPGENTPGGQDRVYAEFGPHNVTFAVPVRIELPYRNTTAYGNSTAVMLYDRQSDTWTPMGGGITADGLRVYYDVPHFSQWGLCDGGAAACAFIEGGGTANGGGG